MASELRVDTLKDSSGNNSVGMSYVAGGSLKSWFNFQQTSTQTINESLNTSSITDGGTGTSTIAFTSSMANTNFTATSGSMNNGTKFQWFDSDVTNSVNVFNSDRDGGGKEDVDEAGTQIAGDLA